MLYEFWISGNTKDQVKRQTMVVNLRYDEGLEYVLQ